MKKIEKLKKYKEILLDCKKVIIINEINNQVNNKLPEYELSRNKQKILTLYKK